MVIPAAPQNRRKPRFRPGKGQGRFPITRREAVSPVLASPSWFIPNTLHIINPPLAPPNPQKTFKLPQTYKTKFN